MYSLLLLAILLLAIIIICSCYYMRTVPTQCVPRNTSELQICLRVVSEALYNHGDTKEACKLLSSLQESGKHLQRLSEEKKDDLHIELQKLNEEKSLLESQKSCFSRTISRLNREKAEAEERRSAKERALTRNREELSYAKRQLRAAQQELVKARERKEILTATSTAVAVVLGVFTLGLGAGAVLGLTGSAAVAVTLLIVKLNGLLKKAEKVIQSTKNNIAGIQREIEDIDKILSSTRSQLLDYSERISENEKKLQDIHDKITAVMHSIAFQKEAVDFWNLFKVSAIRATERTERLQKIVKKAAEKKSIKILRSNGTITIAKSFVDAWDEVAIKQGQILYIQ